MIDRVAADLGSTLVEVPVGFKWFAPGLIAGRLMFAGEDDASATYLRCDGSPWTTDRDGIIMALLAAEIVAATGESPSQRYAELARRHGPLSYAQTGVPQPRTRLRGPRCICGDVSQPNSPAISSTARARRGGQQPTHRRREGADLDRLVRCPAVEARTGVTIHAESCRGAEHLSQIQAEACQIITAALER